MTLQDAEVLYRWLIATYGDPTLEGTPRTVISNISNHQHGDNNAMRRTIPIIGCAVTRNRTHDDGDNRPTDDIGVASERAEL